jgi:hypothetical protein
MRACWLWGFLLGAAVLGCRGEEEMPPLYRVTGKVIHDGRPVQGGSIRFTPVNEQAVIIVNAPVDQEGKFELRTVKGRTRAPGAPEGTYQVSYQPPFQGKTVPEGVTLPETYKVEARENAFTIDVGKR